MTPDKSSAEPSGSQAAEAPIVNRPVLSVKDALSYLDMVKAVFNYQRPEVYNQFLDIMREFKSSQIDTPGVIDRVSALFKGYPTLIQGFNSFLPPTYRLDCVQPDQENPDGYINVFTPAGNFRIESSQATNLTGINPGPITSTATSAPAPVVPSQAPAASTSTAPALTALGPTSAPEGFPTPLPRTIANQVGPETASLPEFSYAVDYVNRIKRRFDDKQKTYNKFLVTLQQYQQDQMSLRDVYQEVTKLFVDAPDLLEDFKVFLPDAQAVVGQDDGPVPARRPGASLDEPPAKKKKTSQLMDAAVSTSKPKASGPRKKPAAADPPAHGKGASYPGGSFARSDEKRDKGSEQKEGGHRKAEHPGRHPDQPPHGVPRGAYDYDLPANGPQDPYARPPSMSSRQAPPPPLPHRAVATAEELAFFDKVSAYISDRALYHEFLKVLNLYTQDIIELHSLVARVRLFLKDAPELWAEFRDMVGWIDGMPYLNGKIEQGEWIIDHIPAEEYEGAKPDLENALTSGPCYRKLPKSETQASCSGRDKLCWEVLNDDWVSHPSWFAEDGFLSGRKNEFEIALHRSEEERYEYEWHIEANLRALTVLEPIAEKIRLMEPAERETFRLKAGLGSGMARTAYQAIIKKIYGHEAGQHVINAIYDNPCVAIPIVVARMKQKDEEWKRAQREWERVWKEADAKNYLKALDHQGVAIKHADKKAIMPKVLVSEIEAIKREQMQTRIAKTRGPFVPDLPRHQLQYTLDSDLVVFDVLKLSLALLDRHIGTFPLRDKDRIEQFLLQFFPDVFCIPAWNITQFLQPREDPAKEPPPPENASDTGDATSDAGGNASATEDEVTPAPPVKGRKRTKKEVADLRRKALKKNVWPRRFGNKTGSPAVDASSAVSSRENTPDVEMSDAATPEPSIGATPELTQAEEMILDSAETPYQRNVPATAGGLDGMEGVQTFSAGQGGTEAAQTETMSDSVRSPPGSVDLPLATGASSARDAGPSKGHLVSHQSLASRVPADSRHRFNFFCGTSHYVLLRIFQMCYQRLHDLRQAAVEIAKQKEGLGASDPVSVSLEAERLYESALALCEQFFDAKLDSTAFEEAVRKLFGIKGYHIFTIDKLISAMLRMVQTVSDLTTPNHERNQRIKDLLQADRIRPDVTATQQLAYRQGIESVLTSEENLYRIEWARFQSQLSFQVLGKDELMPEDEREANLKWKQYMLSYISKEPTEGVDRKYMRKVFLRRHVPESFPTEEELKRGTRASTGLEMRICLRSCRHFFVPPGTDWFARVVKQPNFNEQLAKQRFDAWLNKRLEEILSAGLSEAAALPAPSVPAPEAAPADVPSEPVASATGPTPASEVPPMPEKEATVEATAATPVAQITV